MSVAENPVTEQTATTYAPQKELAVGSFVGAAGLLFSFFVIFGLVPFYWSLAWEKMWAGNQEMLENIYLVDALLLLIEAAIIGAFAYGVYQLSQKYTQHGLRAGIFFAMLYLCVVLFVVG